MVVVDRCGWLDVNVGIAFLKRRASGCVGANKRGCQSAWVHDYQGISFIFDGVESFFVCFRKPFDSGYSGCP
jgi:hypothetical protein